MLVKDHNICWAVNCIKDATHVLAMKHHDATLGDMDKETGYCLEHAIYFAGWLPYCYPGEFELISITPPASELFSK